jgi:serine/threonine protein kinase
MLNYGISASNNYWIELPKYSMDLLKFIEKYNPIISMDERYSILFQINNGIKHIHSNGWMHRDLKLDNILVDDGLNIVIIDLGLSTKISNRSMTIPMGARNYRAYELEYSNFYTSEIDIFALGVLTYEVLIGSNLFKRLPSMTRDVEDGLFKIKKKHTDFVNILSPNQLNLWKRSLGDKKNRPDIYEFTIFFTNIKC